MHTTQIPLSNMNHHLKTLALPFFISLCLLGCKQTNTSPNTTKEFIVEIPEASYPLPVVDYIENNGHPEKKRSIDDNPIVYILRGINDIWKGTNDTYQSKSSANGPALSDYESGNLIIDSVVWKHNIQYVVNTTHNRTDNEAILAYLDEKRAKYYSVIDGFGPLTEAYVKNSGAYVDLPLITTQQILEDVHYQSECNDDAIFAGDENSPLGSVVRLTRLFRSKCSSTSGPKYLYSTPRPWRMNDVGEVIFTGTTYNKKKQCASYSCIDYKGNENFKIFDEYESNVVIVPGLVCSRKNHKHIYDDNAPQPEDLYTNTTENRRTDNGYPSGHTNAGMLSALAYAYAFPERFSEMVYRGSQLGEDRIVAGMHSPVDVIGGKTMALAIACAALNKEDVASEAEKAVQDMYLFFQKKADSANMSLYDFAHQTIENPKGYINGEYINTKVFNNNYYDDIATVKKTYRERLTYGFPQDLSKANQPPMVPKGAEIILKSRFPYLTNNQRRQILYTTEIPAGYKISDKTNGWGRIDLLMASCGYGAFIGDVNIRMDASQGRFNACDTWSNNIGGNGRLIKTGSGKLILSGNNNYSGGTIIKGGTLKTTNSKALGTGQVLIENGKLEVSKSLNINGNLSITDGNVIIHIGDNITSIVSEQEVQINNSTLTIDFENYNIPQSGKQVAMIKGKKLSGSFSYIVANGCTLHCKTVDNTIYVIVD